MDIPYSVWVPAAFLVIAALLVGLAAWSARQHAEDHRRVMGERSVRNWGHWERFSGGNRRGKRRAARPARGFRSPDRGGPDESA